MNNLMLSVGVIPVEDSFVHLSSKSIRELNFIVNHNQSVCLKVTPINNVPEEFYASYSQTPCNSNGDNAFNISYELLSILGLTTSQHVLITVVEHVYPLERIYVTPVTNDDWELLMLNNVCLQDNILQQLRIVQQNKIFPIWVSKFVYLKVLIDQLENGVHIGSLKESTEIVVKPYIMTPPDNAINNNYIDQNVNDKIHTAKICQNDQIPITKFHNRFIFRTILLEKTLLESEYIYDYCALFSKSHMSMLNTNENVYSSSHSFVNISVVNKLDELQNKCKSIIIRLCPLDTFMNNVDKMEIITWPTIYVTKTVSKILSLKMNSKVVLEPINQIDNDICSVQNIYISTSRQIKNVEEKGIITCTIKRLTDEIERNSILVLNNSSSLRIMYNKILTMDIIITFSPSNIPYVFLNEYNFGMLSFIIKNEYQIIESSNLNQVKSDEKTETKFIEENTYSTSKLEYYDLNCFREMIKDGSSCLKLGLHYYSELPQTFFAFDNLLIIGSIASGKTSAAKYFCQKLSKCPYFVKIIWINGRFLAGKLWETVQKQITNYFQECLYYQPAVVVIDDFDDLCHLNSEPNEHADMSKVYLRPLHLLLRIIENYTNNSCCIRVVCTAKTLNQENENLLTNQFKNVFKTVIHIPIINKEDKCLILSKRLNKINFDDEVNDEFLMSICEKMDSYVIQDLIDYCDKVLFEIFKGGSNMILNKTIFTNIYEKTVPLSLHNANLFKENKVNFSFVGGMKKAKQIITETIIWPSVHADVFSKCPLKLQSGVLLYGAPGTGKTLLARAIVGESNLNFISVNGPEILSKYVGQSEEKVRQLFLRAQNAKPCILFFDEFESIVPRRGSDQTGVTDRVVNQFLTQLDGVDTFEGIWVIAATSRPDLIDQALLRPGRIGVKLHCSLPSLDDREDILKVLSKTLTLSEDIDLHSIATETNNYTGADLNGLLFSAYLIAEKKIGNEQSDSKSFASDLTITTEDFREALKTTKPSLNQTSINQYEYIHRVFSGQRISQNDATADDGNDNRRRKKQQKATFA